MVSWYKTKNCDFCLFPPDLKARYTDVNWATDSRAVLRHSDNRTEHQVLYLHVEWTTCWESLQCVPSMWCCLHQWMSGLFALVQCFILFIVWSEYFYCYRVSHMTGTFVIPKLIWIIMHAASIIRLEESSLSYLLLCYVVSMAANF